MKLWVELYAAVSWKSWSYGLTFSLSLSLSVTCALELNGELRHNLQVLECTFLFFLSIVYQRYYGSSFQFRKCLHENERERIEIELKISTCFLLL